MVYFVNTAACFALMFYLIPMAAMSQMWRHKLATICLAVVFGGQIVGSVFGWSPTWMGALTNVALVIAITSCRTDLWRIVQIRFNKPVRV